MASPPDNIVDSVAWSLFGGSSGNGTAQPHCGQCASAILLEPALDEVVTLASLDDIVLANVLSAAASIIVLLRRQVLAVCRRFHHVVQHESICWHRLSLLPASQIPFPVGTAIDELTPCAKITDELVFRLAGAHGHQLLHVHLDGSRLLSAAAISKLAHCCPSLRSVTLVGCVGVGSAAIRFLSRSCTQLEMLRVAGCAAADADDGVDSASLECSAADTTVCSIAAYCPLLRSVSLSSLRSDTSITSLLAGCPQLTALDLAGCQRLPCGEMLLDALAHAQQRLESLKLGDCARLSSLKRLHSCSFLRTLFLGGCSRLCDTCGLGDLLSGCVATIEFVSLVGCRGLSPEGLSRALNPGQSFLKLQTLVLGGCKVDDAVCNVIGLTCPSLTSLDLWNCVRIDNQGIELLLHDRLSQLNLRECRNISGSILETVGLHTHSLHTLDVASIGVLQDEHLQTLLKAQQNTLMWLSCGGPNCAVTDASLNYLPPSLTALDLTECAFIHNFEALARLEQLTSLGLDGCKVPVEHLLDICSSCPLLSLNVAGSLVDDTALSKMAALLPDLMDIDLSGCSSITDAGVDALVNCCMNLVRLGIGACSAVTQACISRVGDVLPACDIVTDVLM